MSLARMTHKAIVMSRREPWVTRRKMVDVLTPHWFGFDLKKDKMGLCEGWGRAVDWLSFALAIAGGPCSEDAGCGSLSAGCLAGINVG